MNVKHLLLVLSLLLAPMALWAQDAEATDAGGQEASTDTASDKNNGSGTAEEEDDGADPECD